MTGLDRSDPVILGHVLAEHRDLFRLMQAVREQFASGGPSTDARRADLTAAIRSLRNHLASHFVQEERGGFLEESVTRVPRLSAMVRSILSQHPALLEELDRLIALVVAAADAEGWCRAERAFAAFAERMHAHERLENTVVQEGYNEDLGLVD